MTTTSTSRTQEMKDARVLRSYLTTLVGREPSGLLEVRARTDGGMTQLVYRADRQLHDAAGVILALSARTDVYVGCAPRVRRAGGLDAVRRVWVLWADCDTPESIAALHAFTPAPAILVRSGTGENRHAYWPLKRPLSAEDATAANRRLAHALGSDGGAVTTAAAILRPPGTRNHKHAPPHPVIAERLRAWPRVDANDLVGSLQDPPTARGVAGGRTPGRTSDDPLLAIAPAVYVPLLTGRTPGRDNKLACPFHDDSTPSFHAYPEPQQGWFCFGCQTGGSIYDLAAAIYGLSTRGREFIELKRRLHQALGIPER